MPLVDTTRTWTPLEGPTQRGSVPPRTPGRRSAASGVSSSVPRACQSVHWPLWDDRVRTSTVPPSVALTLFQVTPSELKDLVERAGSSTVPSADRLSASACTEVLIGPAASAPAEPDPACTSTATPAPATSTAPAVVNARAFRPRAFAALCRLPRLSCCSSFMPLLGRMKKRFTGSVPTVEHG